MIGVPPSTEIEETVSAVTARIREWIGLKIPGIVWIRYISETSREQVLERLSFATPVEQIEFNPPHAAEAAGWLEDQLKNIPTGDSLPVVAVQFAPLFDAGPEGFAAAFQSLNLWREVIARMPLIQLWWIPASLAPKAETEALDLASWFRVKINLSETAPVPTTESSPRVEESRPAIRGRHSLKSLQDAVLRQRKLAASDPNSYLAPLAVALNALADRYRATRQLKEAESSYQEALSIFRRSKKDPEAYLSYVADTLVNLANLYSDTQRMKEAEQSYQEALTTYRRLSETSPNAYLPDVAGTVNNLAILFSSMQRMKESEPSFQEALTTYRRLAEANPEAYLPNVAMTLNNLAVLYSDTQRVKESERSYQEALATYRRLAEANPEAYLPFVAGTLNNLANLYSTTQRIKEAEQPYQEALTIRRRLAEADPEAYLPDVAMTLNNLANLYRTTQRMEDSERSYQEALTTYRRLAEGNREAYLPDVAMTLNNLALLYGDMQRMKEAKESCSEARAILEPLWQQNPELHGNQMARINIAAAGLAGAKQEEACRFARQALDMAYNAAIRQYAQTLIDQFCPPPTQ